MITFNRGRKLILQLSVAASLAISAGSFSTPSMGVACMPITEEQLRNQLSAIEPDDSTYAGIGPPEVPLLAEILKDNEAWMASRAVFALSRIADVDALEKIKRSAADPRQEVRVAVAASVGNLAPEDANQILLSVLNDEDLGVRKFAVQAVTGKHSALVQDKLRDLAAQDPIAAIRGAATEKLRELD
jgi:HEAT repeat protein